MKNKKIDRDLDFIYKACQALAFWIGYSRELYWQRDLVEAASVTELLKLLNAKKKKEHSLLPEYHLDGIELAKNGEGKERVDIIIKENDRIRYAIEIKRANAGKKEICKDFEKLKRIKYFDDKIICLLLIASQNKRPKKFVTSKGLAVKGIIHYDEKNKKYSCKVKRVLKSSHSFKKADSANYVCVIEIIKSEK